MRLYFNIMDWSTGSDQDMYQKITFTEQDTFGGYILATRRSHVEFTDNPASKTLVQLKKNIYNMESCDNKREKSRLQKAA